ncbi:hypothetical protein D021_0310B, partial [Vibrio parahaemolyticus 10296]
TMSTRTCDCSSTMSIFALGYCSFKVSNNFGRR